MTFTSKFNIGDAVVTIDPKTLKLKQFEVGAITTYNSENTNSVRLYAKEDSCVGYDEEKCFANKSDMLKYIDSPAQ